MFNIFNSNVFIEVGEAIGNVGRRLLGRRSHAEQMDAAYRQHLQEPLHITLPDCDHKLRRPEGLVIEGVCRVISEEEEVDRE